MAEPANYTYKVFFSVLTTIEMLVEVPKLDLENLDEDEIGEMKDRCAVKKALSEFEDFGILEVGDSRYKLAVNSLRVII